MTKLELTNALAAAKAEYKDSLQQLWDNVNKGQKKKLYGKAEIKAILDRYGVDVGDI